jgi:hypothetical protein
MAIAADQQIDTGYDFTAKQVTVPHPITGERSGFFMNIREDNDEIVGWTTERYGLVNHKDVISFADNAFASRNIPVQRKIIVTEGGSKMRAQYDLIGDEFQAKVPNVGDVVGYRLTAQNSLDRTLRLAYDLGLLRRICTNGMNTLESEVSMTKKHSMGVNLNDVLSPEALDAALAKMKKSLDIYGRLADVGVSQEQGIIILQNLANAKVFSEKVREEISKLWNTPSYEEDKARNLYNLNNAVTQHLTHEVAGERFEYANRVTTNVLKRFNRAVKTKSVLKKLWTPAKNDSVTITE